jgi:anthranilate/para-aminobenzoate synthase component I
MNAPSTAHYSSPLLALLASENHQQRYACLMDGQGSLNQKTNEWGFLGLDIDCRLDVINNQYYKNGEWVGTYQSTEALFKWIHDETDCLVAAHSLHCLQNRFSATVPAISSVPFQQGWFSCWGYETHQLFEPTLHGTASSAKKESANPFEGMRLCWFESILAWHKPTNTFYGFGVNPEKLTWYLATLHNWEPLLTNDITAQIPAFSEALLDNYDSSFSSESFSQAVDKVQNHIQCGDLYQANLSVQWQQKNAEIDPLVLFETLCNRNPSPFSGLFKTPQGWVLSNSPERLVRCDSTGKLETRPIAGTRGRGTSATEDEAIIASLLSNEKERAEHLMLVDLERNDLGRVCQVGSVVVDDLLTVERYSHVTHLVSNITGQKLEEADWLRVLQAVFPGGTITGCPKIRCIETLAKLEPVNRGAYTGSFGFADVLHGSFDFNILIRTITLLPTHPIGHSNMAGSGSFTTVVQAGAGIVQDSIAAHEYKETLRKASAMFEVLHFHTNRKK